MRKKRTSQKRPLRFRSERDEARFWSETDATDYFNLEREADIEVSAAAFTIPISLRLNRYMLSELKAVARKKDIAYQSLIKTYIARELQRERKAS